MTPGSLVDWSLAVGLSALFLFIVGFMIFWGVAIILDAMRPRPRK